MRDEFGVFTGMFVLITFDIAEKPDAAAMNRRIYRVAKILKGFGTRVQKSVFEAILENTQIDILKTKLAKHVRIDLGDSVRFYKLCNSCYEKIDVFGSIEVSKQEDVYIF